MSEKRLREGIYNCPNCGAAATPDSVRCAYCHTGLASLVCSACLGAIFKGMKHCPWCGAEESAGRPAETKSGACPRCTGRLSPVKIATKSIQECTSCGGLWVDSVTLQQICTEQEEQEAVLGFHPDAETPALDSSARPQRMYIPCPECGKLMNRRQFSGGSGIIVDWCKAHGTWFDRDELKQVVRFILDGGLAKSRQKEKQKLEDEKLHLQEEKRNLLRIARLGSDPDRINALESGDSEILSVLGVIWRDLR
jgi:Zn-finger nucleic acid-binding protein